MGEKFQCRKLKDIYKNSKSKDIYKNSKLKDISKNFKKYTFKMSPLIHEGKTNEIITVSMVLYVIKKIMFIYINFSFDFFGLDNVYF